VFLLWSRTPGRVLRSGRNVVGHRDAPPWPRDVEWLSGCAMSYRLRHLDGQRFDDRLVGYSWGEDLDFSWRLGRRHPLPVARDARLHHLQSPVNRLARRRLTRLRTQLLHAWVREQDGLSVAAFWWSVAGEVLLYGTRALLGRGDGEVAIGALLGTYDVLRHGSSRSAEPR
jgi:GT2 family glycosyltransferase